MTTKDAEIIREWRNEGCSWRRIAEKAFDRWPDRGYISGHQLEGRELCMEAEMLLGKETFKY